MFRAYYNHKQKANNQYQKNIIYTSLTIFTQNYIHDLFDSAHTLYHWNEVIISKQMILGKQKFKRKWGFDFG